MFRNRLSRLTCVLQTVPGSPGRLILALIAAALFFSSGVCAAQDEKKLVVCSTTQVADFARQLAGDSWEVACVLGAGEDPHKYQTDAADLTLVKRADLCLENGWHLEGNEWMKTLAEQAGKPLVSCIEGVERLQLKDEDGTLVNDPHAWLSPTNAWIYTRNIRDAMMELDPENAEHYQARGELYKLQLKALDDWVKEQVNQVEVRMLVTHHDAFGYFCDRYNFQADSPMGWSTADLSSLTVDGKQKIIESIRELGVRSIFVETTINSKTVEQIAEDAGVEIGGELYSDAMGPEGSAGETYIGMMRENVITIVEALK